MHLKLKPHTKAIFYLIFLSGLIESGCGSQKAVLKYESPDIRIEQLTKHAYQHISYLSTNDFGKVNCNGMILLDKGEALIFDTPTNDKDSEELIDWVESKLRCKIIGVVVTHFHDDCLGGLNAFHQRKIPSYASFKTIALSKSDSASFPQIGFEKELELKFGTKSVVNAYLGEGHTTDNIVAYFPDEEVLFGGCLIKAMGASKGYLGDANVVNWSETVQAVKARFGKFRWVIPGHGDPGKSDLLDYTIQMFEDD